LFFAISDALASVCCLQADRLLPPRFTYFALPPLAPGAALNQDER
jgi:hypothetical protein